jgi:hypothetical protein
MIFSILKIKENDKIIIKDSLKLVNSIISAPKDIDSASLKDLFNIIPEVNNKNNLKCLFSLLFAEICRLNGNILFQKNLLENAFDLITIEFGEFNLLNLPIALELSNSYKELGLIDECYLYLNKALKISYLNSKSDSLENLEVLKHLVLFSNYIGEKTEEGVYNLYFGDLALKRLKKFQKILEKNIKHNKNHEKSKFESYSHYDKFFCLILINYVIQHLNHLSYTEKVKDLKYILSKFKEYDIILNQMDVLNENKFQFEKIFDEKLIEDISINVNNSIYLYLHPNIKTLFDPILKNLDQDKKGKKKKIKMN